MLLENDDADDTDDSSSWRGMGKNNRNLDNRFNRFEDYEGEREDHGVRLGGLTFRLYFVCFDKYDVFLVADFCKDPLDSR